MTHLYRGRSAALLTQHGKEAVIGPALAALGCSVELVRGFDTDRLGTFTRDVPREGSQLDAARAKARIGMELSGLPIGLGSEGSFGSDPMLGVTAWSTELVVLLDAERGLELVGFADGPASFRQATVASVAEALAFAERAGMPEHGLVVRPDGPDDRRIVKGLRTAVEVERAVGAALAQSATGTAFVETDGRAHANATRMAVIAQAAENLAAKLASTCPACASPGFWSIEPVRGMPCRACAMPTHVVVAEVMGCPACEHRERREREGATTADPQYCEWCNP